jgi:Lipase (class 3)
MRVTPNGYLGSVPQSPSVSPHPPEFTTEVLDWTFTRPIDGRFDVSNFRGYWALHLAESAQLIYGDETFVCSTLTDASCTNIRWFDRGSTQAVGYIHEGYACLVFRGTQEKEDWLVDATSILWGSPGRHLGFHRAWRSVEPDVTQWLNTLPRNTKLLTAGHSLGGALAILAAFELSPNITIRMVQTFGAPRVGALDFRLAYNRRLARVTRQFHYGADVVAIVPPPPLFIHVCPGTRIQATFVPGQPEYPNTALGWLGSYLNYTSIPTRMFAREPVAAFLLSALTFVVLFTPSMNYVFSHLPAWFSNLAHSHLREALLIAISIPLLEQLSYLIPIEIPFSIRCLIAVAVVALLVIFHINVLWIIPTLVWTFILTVLLLRALLPSGKDHHMAGYLNALHRPFRDDPAYRPFDPNNDIYTSLGLRRNP